MKIKVLNVRIVLYNLILQQELWLFKSTHYCCWLVSFRKSKLNENVMYKTSVLLQKTCITCCFGVLSFLKDTL